MSFGDSPLDRFERRMGFHARENCGTEAFDGIGIREEKGISE
jgi:hypothetical protein